MSQTWRDRWRAVPSPIRKSVVLTIGATLLALGGGETLGEPWMAREARDLLRRLLAPHLGTRPIKSRELFRQARGKMPHRSTRT